MEIKFWITQVIQQKRNSSSNQPNAQKTLFCNGGEKPRGIETPKKIQKMRDIKRSNFILHRQSINSATSPAIGCPKISEIDSKKFKKMQEIKRSLFEQHKESSKNAFSLEIRCSKNTFLECQKENINNEKRNIDQMPIKTLFLELGEQIIKYSTGLFGGNIGLFCGYTELFLRIYRSLLRIHRALLRHILAVRGKKRGQQLTVLTLGLFCGYTGLFLRIYRALLQIYTGLFCAYVRLFCGYIGHFCGYVGLFCG